MVRDRFRQAAGSLLILVLWVLATGYILVYVARMRTGFPVDAVNLNTANATELALTFEIDPALAEILTEHRKYLGGFMHVDQLRLLPIFPAVRIKERMREVVGQSRVDLQTADVSGLAEALGVFRPVARRIIDYRNTLPAQRFQRPEDILKVPVLDAQVVDRLLERLIVRRPVDVLWRYVLSICLLGGLFILLPAFLYQRTKLGDPLLFPLTFLLAGLGVMVLFSIKDPLRDTLVFLHHVKGLFYGAAALLFGALMPARSRQALRHYSYLWVLMALLLLLLLRLFGHGPEGARLSLFFFQPVEIVKILFMLFLAGYLSAHGDQLADALHRWNLPVRKNKMVLIRGLAAPRRQDFAPLLGMFTAAIGLFLIVRDLGPALVLYGAVLVTLYLATARSGIVLVGGLLVVFAGWLAYMLNFGVLPVRVEMWLNPWQNAHPNGIQLGQGLWAMASGGVWGTGLGLGATGLIPRGGSDLVFASLGEELGLIGSLAVLILYVLLIWRGLRIALQAQNDFDRLLAAGFTSLLGSQVFFITAGVTGLLPLTGITLPFIAYGTSSLVANMFIVGILWAISVTGEGVSLHGQSPLFRRTVRKLLMAAAFVLLGLVGVGRLFWVQAIAADQIAGRLIRTPDADRVVRAKVNPRLLAIERTIERGSIYDRRGRVLATSRLKEISRELEDNPMRAREFYRKGRYYPRGAAFAHLVGYLNPAFGGPTGLEKEYHAKLRGFQSYSDLVADYRSKDLPRWLTSLRPRAGQDLVLTLDADLQEEAYRILRHVKRAQGDAMGGAAMVVLDPRTGEVLVSASLPTFDPNTLTSEKWQKLRANEDKSHRLIDRARAGVYPPGSSIKIVTAAAGLEEGLEPFFTCRHVWPEVKWSYRGQTYARRQIRDDQGDPPHGRIGMAQAMEVSCNLYFANLGLRLGPEKLHRTLVDWFALRHIAPLPIFAADLPDNAYGQGTMLVTPMEMARIAAAVANKGIMMQPRYVREVREPNGVIAKQFSPTRMGHPFGELNGTRLAEMMHRVVKQGTARGIFDNLSVQVAGKTGTAETKTGNGRPHSWFIGYAPYSRPQYAFACIIENGGYGRRVAAPAVGEMLREIFGR
jgi:cell division protein FtsI/penicillin-binding protein 2/cell division protein FtsW (lipid II flippase)/DNA uptake protein ComE-like DNA-binding protein